MPWCKRRVGGRKAPAVAAYCYGEAGAIPKAQGSNRLLPAFTAFLWGRGANGI